MQEMLLLALSADTGITTPTPDACNDAMTLFANLTDTDLPFINAQSGNDWSIVWGPAVLSMKNRKGSQTVVNVTYVAQNSSDGSYAICIAGTDFDSWYDWLVEDGTVIVERPCMQPEDTSPFTCDDTAGEIVGNKELDLVPEIENASATILTFRC